MVKIAVNVELTPKEIENEIWEMDSTEQADLIFIMAQRYKREYYDFIMQLAYISDDFNELLTQKEKQNIIRMFEETLEYLKGGD